MKSKTTKIGAVYCLYLLHATQPREKPFSFPLPLAFHRMLMQLLEEGQREMEKTSGDNKSEKKDATTIPVDMMKIILKMVSDRSFYVSAAAEMIPPPTNWPLDTKQNLHDLQFQNEDTLAKILPKNMDEVEKEYFEAELSRTNLYPIEDKISEIVQSHSRTAIREVRAAEENEEDPSTFRFEGGATYETEKSLTTMIENRLPSNINTVGYQNEPELVEKTTFLRNFNSPK